MDNSNNKLLGSIPRSNSISSFDRISGSKTKIATKSMSKQNSYDN